jgi:hypothetical protein
MWNHNRLNIVIVRFTTKNATAIAGSKKRTEKAKAWLDAHNSVFQSMGE